jgi:hypothetical protein
MTDDGWLTAQEYERRHDLRTLLDATTAWMTTGVEPAADVAAQIVRVSETALRKSTTLMRVGGLVHGERVGNLSKAVLRMETDLFAEAQWAGHSWPLKLELLQLARSGLASAVKEMQASSMMVGPDSVPSFGMTEDTVASRLAELSPSGREQARRIAAKILAVAGTPEVELPEEVRKRAEKTLTFSEEVDVLAEQD